MYCFIRTFDNSSKPYEKRVNPVNMAIRPSDINRLTSEGRSISMHQLDGCLYYPNIAKGVMPLEFTRGVDINDAWEASQKASRKVKDYVSAKENLKSEQVVRGGE